MRMLHRPVGLIVIKTVVTVSASSRYLPVSLLISSDRRLREYCALFYSLKHRTYATHEPNTNVKTIKLQRSKTILIKAKAKNMYKIY